jgi:hypothetical protein
MSDNGYSIHGGHRYSMAKRNESLRVTTKDRPPVEMAAAWHAAEAHT